MVSNILRLMRKATGSISAGPEVMSVSPFWRCVDIREDFRPHEPTVRLCRARLVCGTVIGMQV